MPQQAITTESILSNLSRASQSSQSILDIFTLQNLISMEDASKIKGRLKTNREIENFLLKNRLLSRDSINKAYSIVLRLPFISLKSVEIPQHALSAIPKKIAYRYKIIPFDMKENLVRLAISRPGDLLASYPAGLAKLLSQKGLALEIFVTGESDFNEAFSQYDSDNKNKLLLKHGSVPVINLRNYNILPAHLSKIPRQYVEKYRMVIFEQNVVGDYLVACENPDSSVTQKVLQYLKDTNQISLEVFSTSKEDMDYAISLYDKYYGQTQRKISNTENQPEQPEDLKKTIKSSPFDFSFGLLSNKKKKEPDPELTVEEVAPAKNSSNETLVLKDGQLMALDNKDQVVKNVEMPTQSAKKL